MNNKSILMPHKCQATGWWILLLTVLIHVVKVIIYYCGNMDAAWYMAKAVHFLLLLSLFLIAFSREKVEDEMISGLRLRAIGITGYVFFVGFMILSLVLELRLYLFIPLFNMEGFDMLELYMSEFFLILLPILIVGLYYLIFRGMLRRSRKEEAI